MSLQTVARRYAAALVDVVTARNEAARVQGELQEWENMIYSNPLLREAISNPTIPYEQKRKMLQELIVRTRVGPTTSNFLHVLLKNQRLTELLEINRRFKEVLDERAGIIGAHVVSARPVPDRIKQALEEKLVAMTGRAVRLSFDTDESLIGGLITRIGSTVYDGSIQTQLQQLRERLVAK